MAKSIYTEVGRRISQHRRDLGMSQEALAENAELTTSFIARIEGGSRRATLESLERIANALGVPLGRLVADEDVTATGIVGEIAKTAAVLPPSDRHLVAQIARRLSKERRRRPR